MNTEKILITGASGFIGSFIVEEALRQGFETWAAVRKSSSKEWLQDERIHFIELNLSSKEQLTGQLRGQAFDYVVHAAGATKALSSSTFYEVNTEGTKHLVEALKSAIPSLKRFILLSSLSIFGPIHEQQPYQDITDSDTPRPNTAYGKSKLAAEEWLQREGGIPYTILRPTGVYGPREKDYMLMADSIRKGMDVAVGFKPQALTFIFVSDLVEAAFQAMKSEKTEGKAYILSDGETYTSRQFSDLIIEHLGKRHVLRPTFPLWVLRIVCAVSDAMMHLTGKLSTLNNDHFNVLKQRNWKCDITPARRDFGFKPKVLLPEGVRRMLESEE